MATKKITELAELQLTDVVDDLGQIVLLAVDLSTNPATTRKIKLSSLDAVFERSINALATTSAKFTLEPIVTSTVLNANYTIPLGYNATTINPILSSGVNISILPGSNWSIK
jgi:hypothetical protein